MNVGSLYSSSFVLFLCLVAYVLTWMHGLCSLFWRFELDWSEIQKRVMKAYDCIG